MNIRPIFFLSIMLSVTSCMSVDSNPPGGTSGVSPLAVLPSHWNDQTLAQTPGEFDAISTQGLPHFFSVAQRGRLPRGAALMSTSGTLNAQGVTHILHAASGSSSLTSSEFIPTLDGVSDSIRNSLILANRHGLRRVAIPYIGGGIFRTRIGVSHQTLTDAIIRSALRSKGSVEIRFVVMGQAVRAFQSALARILLESEFSRISRSDAQVIDGSIIDFSAHQSDGIINAANMEVEFGGGVSGVIGTATGQSRLIDQEALRQVQRFNTRVLSLFLGSQAQAQSSLSDPDSNSRAGRGERAPQIVQDFLTDREFYQRQPSPSAVAMSWSLGLELGAAMEGYHHGPFWLDPSSSSLDHQFVGELMRDFPAEILALQQSFPMNPITLSGFTRFADSNIGAYFDFAVTHPEHREGLMEVLRRVFHYFLTRSES